MEKSLYGRLERLFHEPARLAILSELAGSANPISFVDLKTRCGLTDGNLNRHLHQLEEAKVVKIAKRFVDLKPQTTVMLSPRGREAFLEYLSTLEKVLAVAAERASSREIEPEEVQLARRAAVGTA